MWYKRLKDGWRSLGNEPGLDLQSTSLNDYVTSQESTLIMHDHRVTIREFSNEVLTLTINYILRVSSHFCFCFFGQQILEFWVGHVWVGQQILDQPNIALIRQPLFDVIFLTKSSWRERRLQTSERVIVFMSTKTYIQQTIDRKKKLFCVKNSHSVI